MQRQWRRLLFFTKSLTTRPLPNAHAPSYRTSSQLRRLLYCKPYTRTVIHHSWAFRFVGILITLIRRTLLESSPLRHLWSFAFAFFLHRFPSSRLSWSSEPADPCRSPLYSITAAPKPSMLWRTGSGQRAITRLPHLYTPMADETGRLHSPPSCQTRLILALSTTLRGTVATVVLGKLPGGDILVSTCRMLKATCILCRLV